MECCCCLRDVQDLLADGKTPYERRFGESFKGPIIPFAGRPIACMTDLFNISLQEDDVQDFSTQDGTKLFEQQLKYRQKRSWKSFASQVLQASVQLQTSLALYEQENIRNNEPPSYSRLKTTVRRHIDQTMWTRNFRARSEIVGRGAVTKSQKGKKACVERKVRECYQWKATRQCSKRDSCSFIHDPASGNRGESPSGTRNRIPCRHFLRRKFANPSCNCWHPPVCLNYKSESGCTYGEKCRSRHVEADGQPSQKSKKSCVK